MQLSIFFSIKIFSIPIYEKLLFSTVRVGEVCNCTCMWVWGWNTIVNILFLKYNTQLHDVAIVKRFRQYFVFSFP